MGFASGSCRVPIDGPQVFLLDQDGLERALPASQIVALRGRPDLIDSVYGPVVRIARLLHLPPMTPNRCRSCGASSYRRLVHRGDDGETRYSDTYRWLEFTKLSSWRERRLRPRNVAVETPVTDEQLAQSVSSAGQGGTPAMTVQTSFQLR